MLRTKSFSFFELTPSLSPNCSHDREPVCVGIGRRWADADFGAACDRIDSARGKRSDRHNEIELNLLEQGSVTYLLGGQKVTISAGRLALFWAGTPHQIIGFESKAEYFIMTIPLVWFLQWWLCSSHAVSCPAVRQIPLFSPSRIFACRAGSCSGLF